MLLKPGETITTDDYHTAGEPFRILNFGPMEGETVLDRRCWAQTNLDDLRRFLVSEPRGHSGMYGGFVVPPDDDNGDLGVVFFHSNGFSTACGHGTIALVTWALDQKVVDQSGNLTEVVVDVPSGRLLARAQTENHKVTSVLIKNVPSFVTETDIRLETKYGPINVEIAFGGAFYAFVSTNNLPISARREDLQELVAIGKEVKESLGDHPRFQHPTEHRLSGCYGTIFWETLHPAEGIHNRERNVTVFADGQIDRSPCGSGTSARLALLHHHNQINVDDPFFNKGVAGGNFVGKVESVDHEFVTTTVEGSAHQYAQSTFYYDPTDSMALGFKPL